MPEYKYDKCIDCGAICEDTRCRQCWAKEVLRQSYEQAGEVASTVADVERFLGIGDD